MVRFKSIEPTDHYLEEHERDVPWEKVIGLLLTTKDPKKIGNKFKIERDGYYILFEIRDDILYVINAKR